MKRYVVMVNVRTNDPECCYDTHTTEYSGKEHKGRLDADLEALRSRKDHQVETVWVEEREVIE